MGAFLRRGIPLLVAMAVTSGCVTRRASYNPSYVPAVRPAAHAPGRAVLLVESPDADYVYTGRKLKDLFDQGLISKEAYEAKQKDILEGY